MWAIMLTRDQVAAVKVNWWTGGHTVGCEHKGRRKQVEASWSFFVTTKYAVSHVTHYTMPFQCPFTLSWCQPFTLYDKSPATRTTPLYPCLDHNAIVGLGFYAISSGHVLWAIHLEMAVILALCCSPLLTITFANFKSLTTLLCRTVFFFM